MPKKKPRIDALEEAERALQEEEEALARRKRELRESKGRLYQEFKALIGSWWLEKFHAGECSFDDIQSLDAFLKGQEWKALLGKEKEKLAASLEQKKDASAASSPN
ncbi:hypothetical protein VF04_27975, partial [Nostoc linckia z7]